MSSQLLKKSVLYVGVTLLLTLVVSWTFAQNSERVLIPGTPVTGTLDTVNPIQVYSYHGDSG